MPTVRSFAILRDVPAGFTWEQMDAAAIQNLASMDLRGDQSGVEFVPGSRSVQWVRTYWEPGSDWAVCLYTAQDQRTLEEWHHFCQVPFAGIREIDVEEGPAAASEYPRGFHTTPETAPLVAVEVATEAGARDGLDGHRWVRTYRDLRSGEELQLFVQGEAPVDRALPGQAKVRRVVELRPEDYE